MRQLLCTALLLAATSLFSLAGQCTYSKYWTKPLSEDKQTAVLKVINDYRDKLAKGEQPNGVKDDGDFGDPLPAAKQIDPLTWSCTLEDKARKVVDICFDSAPTAPSGNTGFFYFGFYNVDSFLKSRLAAISSLSISASAIGEEDVKFDGGSDLLVYANLMREDISEIGCMEDVCIINRTFTSNLVYCLTNKETKRKMSGKHWDARYSQKQILDMHNYRRSELAKGNIAKQNGNYLPQSSDMQRMRYNCALEKGVINYVSTCPSSKSAESARPQVGENFIRLPQEGLATYMAAVQKAVTSWWKVIRSEEGPGLQVYFRQKHVDTPIESFTQMGWSTSRKLGCAIAKCGSDYVAVCRYSPRGNYVEQVIYKKGTPCTACAAGSWCTEDALCTPD